MSNKSVANTYTHKHWVTVIISVTAELKKNEMMHCASNQGTKKKTKLDILTRNHVAYGTAERIHFCSFLKVQWPYFTWLESVHLDGAVLYFNYFSQHYNAVMVYLYVSCIDILSIYLWGILLLKIHKTNQLINLIHKIIVLFYWLFM